MDREQSTPCITLNVTENLYSDSEIESSNEYSALTEALQSLPSAEVINGKYTKPESGIPKSDLAQDVQNSLNKANTALQEHQSLAAYRTASEQDAIDATKQNIIILRFHFFFYKMFKIHEIGRAS